MAPVAKSKGTSKIPSKVQQQKESLAAREAQRLLSEPEQTDAEQVIPSRPLTFTEKLKRLEQDAAEELARNKARLAGENLRDCQTRLNAYIEGSDDDELKRLYRELNMAKRLANDTGGIDGGGRTQPTVGVSSNGLLSADDAREKVAAAVRFLKDAKEPVSTSDLGKAIGYSKLTKLLASEIQEGTIKTGGKGRGTTFQWNG